MTDLNTSNQVNYLTPCLLLHQETKVDPIERNLVQFTLKVKAGSGSTAPTYKKKVERFYSGTPTEWIEVLACLEEIWTLNGVTSAADREAVLKLFSEMSH